MKQTDNSKNRFDGKNGVNGKNNPLIEDDVIENNDKNKTLNKSRLYWIIPILFFGLLAFLAVSDLLVPDKELSTAERRKLKSFPEFSLTSVLDGTFGSEIEGYLSDQNAFRTFFLNIRSIASQDLFLNQDDNGIIERNGSLISLERENEGSLDYAAKVFDGIYTRYLENTNCKVYLSIIPDKAYFLNDPSLALMDYDKFMSDALKKLDYAKYIDITNTLSLDDYYHSDTHWKQENLAKTANALAEGMHVSLLDSWNDYAALENFKGVYSSRTALQADQDEIRLLYNPLMDDWTVTSYASGKPEKTDLYSLEKLSGLDPYEVYLGGNTGLMSIENPHAGNGRELVVFKDSFGSSLIPLLASGYSKVWIVDIRNMPSSMLGRYIDFTDQDVLFLYSTSVLNNSFTLK